MIKVFSFDVYTLLDPGLNLSFVTLCIAMSFYILLGQLLVPFSVSTPFCKSFLVERILSVLCDLFQSQGYHG